MRIAGMMVCGPNEPHLKKVLEQFERLKLSPVLIVGNNLDGESIKLIHTFGFYLFHDEREWGKHQPDIKSDLLKRFIPHQPDWIVACDADEFFDEGVTRETLEELAERGGIAWNFYVVNYWNDEDHYAKGLSFWNVRFFKFTPEYGLDFIHKPVHCGLAPPMQYRYANDSPFILWHYGLMDKEKRLRKVERYKKYDPNAAYKSDLYYQSLADPTPPAPLNRDELRARVREDVKNRKMKVVFTEGEPEGYSVVERDGRKIDVMTKDVRRYEKQGWKLVSKIELPKAPQQMYADADSPVPEMEDNNTCPLCGKQNRSLSGLKSHMRAAHP